MLRTSKNIKEKYTFKKAKLINDVNMKALEKVTQNECIITKTLEY